MSLPDAFLARMQSLLGAEFDDFISSFDAARAQGLRVNQLRCSPADFAESQYFSLTPVPWCEEGFYYLHEERPGKHALYEAGVYYIQEPSAMAVGAIADPKPGEWVLDLCAAPGGKSTHLAGRMQGQGILVSNEIHPARAKILAQSVERAGICNAVVTNETPARLAERFADAFDCVVVDAPCSGEGMFRKDAVAVAEWEEESPHMCAIRQDEILDEAVKMVRPGGRLIYSTCTFAPEENEGTVSRLLARHGDFSVAKIEEYPWFDEGRPEWQQDCDVSVQNTFRLWPHHLRGEGHFCAMLVRAGSEPRSDLSVESLLKKPPEYAAFEKENLTAPFGTSLLRAGDRLWAVPQDMPPIHGLRVLRSGLELGEVRKGRFMPAHAFALALHPESVRRVVKLASNSAEATRYLHGDTISCDCENGWALVTVDGFPLGWGKAVDGTLKNHLPKGLRWK